MKNIDWFFMRRSIILFITLLIIGISAMVAGYQYEKVQRAKYDESLVKLKNTHSAYINIVKDIDLFDQYRTLFSEYKATGLVGDERRLSWIETLEDSNEALRLPKLNYSLLPQEKFIRPGFKVKKGINVNSSPMDLTMGILHEEDLFALVDSLRDSIKNLFTIDSCVLTRSGNPGQSLNTKKPNMNTTCRIRWITINAK